MTNRNPFIDPIEAPDLATKIVAKDGTDDAGYMTVADVLAVPVSATGGSQSRSLADRFGDVVNVKDFGALGNSNGTTGNGADDTVAIQAALDYAASVSSKLYFPEGVYRITASIEGNASNTFYQIYGSGYGSKIYLDAGTDVFAFSFFATSLATASLIPLVTIELLNFIQPTTSATANNAAICLDSHQFATIRDCWFSQYHTGILVFQCYGTRVVSCNISNMKSCAILCVDSSFNVGAIVGNSIHGCGLTTNDAAVSIDASNGGLVIANNDVEGNYGGFLFTGNTDCVAFTSNYMELNTTFDIYFSGTQRSWMITGNRFGSGLTVQYETLINSVVTNNIYGGGAGTANFNATNCGGNIVLNNRVEAGSTLTVVDMMDLSDNVFSGAAMKMPNNRFVQGENAAGGTFINCIGVDSSNRVQIGQAGTNAYVPGGVITTTALVNTGAAALGGYEIADNGTVKWGFYKGTDNSFFVWNSAASAIVFQSGAGATPTLGFFGATPVAKPTGIAVTAVGIHAALVSLGLIAT